MPTSKSSISSERKLRRQHLQRLADDLNYKALLGELLAVLHRDGSQYTTLAGYVASIEDAEHNYYDLRRKYDAVCFRLKQLVPERDAQPVDSHHLVYGKKRKSKT